VSPAVATPTPTPTAVPLSFAMQGVGSANAAITGTAEVARGTSNFQLTVRLRGLPPSSNHIAHIHVGSCASNGAIDVPLQPLVADGSGNATSITTVNRDYAIPPAGWYANVHQGPDLQGDNAKPMACGDLKAA
jgi:CHRD domain